MLLKFFLDSENYHINFVEKQMVGKEYLINTYPLQMSLAKHRDLTNAYLNGNKNLASQIQSERNNIENNLENLKQLDVKHSSVLIINHKLSSIKNEWENLKLTSFNIEATQSFNTHNQLIKQIHDLILHDSTQSKLILDASVANNYLFNVEVNVLPVLINELGQLRGSATEIINKQEITFDQRVELKLHIRNVKSYISNLKKMLVIAYSNTNDIELKQNLVNYEKELDSAINIFYKKLMIIY